MTTVVRAAASCLALGSIALAVGCMRVTIGRMSIGAPVLMSPIERTGDSEPRRTGSEKAIPFEGEVGVTVVGAGRVSEHREGDTVVTTVHLAGARMFEDALSEPLMGAWRKAGGSRQNIIYVDDLRAQAWMHGYVFLFAGGVDVEVSGTVKKARGAGE